MRCHATRSVAAKYMYDITVIARGKNTFLRVNRNFVKCYSNKKRIKALELPLRAQHNDVSSVFVAFTEIKLWLFKILDIYAWVHYTMNGTIDIRSGPELETFAFTELYPHFATRILP